MNLKDKRVLVTGAGSGVGRELVLALLRRGAIVIGFDISATSLAQTCELAGKDSPLKTMVVDVGDRAAVEYAATVIEESYGPVDVVINNAGIIHPFIKLNDLPYDVVERVMKVNFYGSLFMTKAFLPVLLSRPKAHIVNVCSMGAFIPVPGQTLYCASKAAVKLMTEGLASELKDTTVDVSVVFPGALFTNIMANSGLPDDKKDTKKVPKSKMTLPCDAAEAIVEGIIHNRPRIVIGRDAKFLDFFSRFSPTRAASFVADRMKRV